MNIYYGIYAQAALFIVFTGLSIWGWIEWGRKKWADMAAFLKPFEHGADVGIRGKGKSLSEAFENGAKSMFSLLVEDLDTITPEKSVIISCESYDLEGLFVAWLNSFWLNPTCKG